MRPLWLYFGALAFVAGCATKEDVRNALAGQDEARAKEKLEDCRRLEQSVKPDVEYSGGAKVMVFGTGAAAGASYKIDNVNDLSNEVLAGYQLVIDACHIWARSPDSKENDATYGEAKQTYTKAIANALDSEDIRGDLERIITQFGNIEQFQVDLSAEVEKVMAGQRSSQEALRADIRQVQADVDQSAKSIPSALASISQRLDRIERGLPVPESTSASPDKPVTPACPSESENIDVFFSIGRFDLSYGEQQSLTRRARGWADTKAQVEVVAFADGSGSPQLNLFISERRAETVRALLEQAGVTVLMANGKGSAPNVTGDNPAARVARVRVVRANFP